jgi:hypothetical protein
MEGRSRESAMEWQAQSREPIGPTELAAVASAHADTGDDLAKGYIERLRAYQPIEADAIWARLMLRQGRFADATEALRVAFEAYRIDPWPWPLIMENALQSAKEIGARSPEAVVVLRPALEAPFAVAMLDEARAATPSCPSSSRVSPTGPAPTHCAHSSRTYPGTSRCSIGAPDATRCSTMPKQTAPNASCNGSSKISRSHSALVSTSSA